LSWERIRRKFSSFTEISPVLFQATPVAIPLIHLSHSLRLY